MRTRTMIALTSLIALAPPGLSRSDSEGYFFDCDVPPANVSIWRGPVDSANAVRVSGTIQMLEARHDDRWRPVGSIFLVDAEDRVAGIQVYFEWRQADTLHVRLYTGERIPLTRMLMSDSRIPFEFSVGPYGNLVATVNDVSKTVSLKEFNARRIQLSCSSGQFKFEKIIVDYE